MKIVETKLYNINELEPQFIEQAEKEYYNSFLQSVMEIDEVWFTSGGNIYAIFNT